MPPVGTLYGYVFCDGSKGYMGCGMDLLGNLKNDFWEYEPTTDTWTQKMNYAGSNARGMISFAIGNRAYLGTGETYGGTFVSELWEYNPTSNAWLQKASMSSVRVYGSSFSIGSKGYVGLGATLPAAFLADVWEYTPAESRLWSTGSTLQAIPVSTSGAYSLTVTNSATGCSVTVSQSVNLSPTPSISINIAGVPCAGSSNTITASGAATYSWSSNAGSATSNSVIVTPTASTTYTLSGSNGGCTVNYPVALTVGAVPAVTLSTLGSATVCGTSITLSASVASGNTWTQKNSMPLERISSVGFSIGSKGYVGTGYNGLYQNDFWEYDPSTNSWTQKATFPGGARYGAVGLCIGSKGYIGTGYNGSGTPIYYKDFWEYDPAGNTWTQKTDFGGSSRYFCAAFTIGAKGYVGTGNNGSNLNDFWEFDPLSNTWTQKASLSIYRYQAFGMSISGKGYIGAGAVGSTYFNDLWEYNPVADNWTQKNNMGTIQRYGAVAFTIGNKGYVGGGSNANDVWEYTPATASWAQIANFSGPARWNPIAFSIDGKGYMGTGNGSSYFADLWEYNPASTYSWSTGSSQPSIAVTTSGTYSLTAVNAFGCSNTLSQALSITPVPTLAINGASAICAGGNTTFTTTGASTYTWSANAGSATTTTISVSPASTATYVVMGATNNCTATVSKTLVVNALPSVSATASGTLVCQGIGVTLNGSGAATYAWNGGVTNNTAFAPVSTASYTVTGTDLNSCTNTAAITVSVKPSPTITVNSGSICAGQSFTIVPNGAQSYTYSGGSSVVAPGSSNAYTVTGTNSVGCVNYLPAIAAVTVYSLPVISVSDATICIGKSYTITPGGASTYTYSSGSPVVTPSSSQSYSVSGTSSVGCVSSAQSVLTISVAPLPTISFSGGTLCSGQSFTLSPSGASTYTYSGGSAIVSPSSNQTYSVTGSSNLGCVSSNTATATLTVLTSPTVSVNSGSICAGQVFTLSASGAATYTYAGGSATVNPSANATYTVAGTNSLGCVSNVAVASITVNANPTISASSTLVCIGNSYTIVPTGAGSYTYSGGSGTVSPATTTSYSISGTSTAGCISLAPAVINITVAPLPTVSVNSGSICSGKSFTLVPSGANTYTYSGGSAIVSPGSSASFSVTGTSTAGCIAASPAVASVTVFVTPTISVNSGSLCSGQIFTLVPSGAVTYTYSGGSATVSPLSNSSYSVTGTSSLGCVSNTVVASLTVNATPTLAVNSGSVCAGQVFTLVPTGADTYVFSSGAATVLPVNTGTYAVTGSNTTGCIASNTAIATVTVYSLPLVSIAGQTAICQGASASLNASGALTYSWSTGAGSSQVSVSPAASAVITATGTAINGCVNTASIVITVNSLPAITANASSTSVCTGGSITLSGGGATTYTWSGGLSNNTALYPTSSATYTVSGTNANGCSNSATVQVLVHLLPTVLISSSADTICAGQSATLTASGANTYSWSNGDITPFSVISPSATISYSVTGNDVNGCKATVQRTQVVSECLGITTNQKDIGISIYPNPSNGELTLLIKDYSTVLQVEIYNAVSQLVSAASLGSQQTTLNLSAVAKGMYVVRILDHGKVLHQEKLIITD